MMRKILIGGGALAVAALILSCDPAPQDPEGSMFPRFLRPSFSIGETGCGYGEFWDENAGLAEPKIVVPNLAQCGDLSFLGQTARFDTLTYRLRNVWSDPSWHLWRRGKRSAATGSIAVDTPYFAQHALSDTVHLGGHPNFTTQLSQDYDNVGFEMIPLADESQSVGSFPSHPEELYAQFWRRIPAPIIDSMTVHGDSVCIYWDNGHEERSIDSTWVYRGAGLIATVGPTSVQHTDVAPDTGTYVYRLRHFSPPVTSFGPAEPASAFSVDTVRVLSAPADFGCNRLPKFQYQVRCGWTNADASRNTQVFRNDSLKATVDPGVSTYTDAGLPTTSGSVYAVRHESGGDVTGFSNPDTVWGALTATPSSLSCGGCVTCQWQNGSAGYATEIWRSETSETQGYAIRDTVAAATSNYTDAAVDSLVTYWYRVRHIGFYAFGPDSEADSVVACTFEPFRITP